MADKSNAMQQGHALWQRVFKQVAAEYPGHHGDAPVHRRAGDVPGEGPGAVPGDRHQQPVRRHHHRHRRRAAGRPGHGGVRQHPSGPDVAVRAGARLGAAAGRQERRQSDGRDPVGGADARDARAQAKTRRAIERAVEAAVHAGQTTTDIGGTLGTREVGDWIAARLPVSCGHTRSSEARRAGLRPRRGSHHMAQRRFHPRRGAHADDRLHRRAEGRVGARARRHRRARRVRRRPASSRTGSITPSSATCCRRAATPSTARGTSRSRPACRSRCRRSPSTGCAARASRRRSAARS